MTAFEVIEKLHRLAKEGHSSAEFHIRQADGSYMLANDIVAVDTDDSDLVITAVVGGCHDDDGTGVFERAVSRSADPQIDLGL